jgi:hypothetical protein
VGPEDRLVVDVERVGAVPRRVRLVVVKRVEVVIDGFDLRALSDVEAKADEYVLDLLCGLSYEVQPADRGERVGRQRDVDLVGFQAFVELLGFELVGPLFDQVLERLSRLVGCLAGWAALLGRERGGRLCGRGIGSGPARVRLCSWPR